MKSVFTALSWHFEPLRFGCRRSRFRPRHFYRITLINSRFDNVHPVVRSRPLIEAKCPFTSLRLNFHVKLPAEGNWKLPATFHVLASIIHLRLLLLRPTPPPSLPALHYSVHTPSRFFHPLRIRFITFRISIYNDFSFFDFVSLFTEKSIVLSRPSVVGPRNFRFMG